MRNLYYFVACTLDGFIADPNGSFDMFLQHGPHVEDFLASYARFDTVLMGRKTYDVGLNLGITSPYPTMQQFVFSRTLEKSPDPQVKLVRNDAKARVKELKRRHGRDIWLCGGGQLAAYLWSEKLIDGLILKQNPILLGEGISLFSEVIATEHLTHRSSQVYANGVVVSTYMRQA